MTTTFSPTVKPVQKKRDQSKRRASYQPKITANGRPTKRTPEVEKALLAAIETGAPYRIACMAVGISDDAFTEWRRRDSEFADRVNKAAGRTALRLLKKIEKNADENFSAAAWLLERRFPESFSRPEIQLGLTINQTMNNNTLIISAEQAESLQKRSKAIDVQLDEIEKVYNSRRGSAEGATEMLGAAHEVREVEAEASSLVATGPISLPPGDQRNPGWWRQLSTGDHQREIAPEAAEFVLRTVASQTLGAHAAGRLKIDFGREGLPVLSELWSAISESCGSNGWAALVKRGANPSQDGPAGSAGRVASA